jgi:hypothetical protein
MKSSAQWKKDTPSWPRFSGYPGLCSLTGLPQYKLSGGFFLRKHCTPKRQSNDWFFCQAFLFLLLLPKDQVCGSPGVYVYFFPHKEECFGLRIQNSQSVNYGGFLYSKPS